MSENYPLTLLRDRLTWAKIERDNAMNNIEFCQKQTEEAVEQLRHAVTKVNDIEAAIAKLKSE